MGQLCKLIFMVVVCKTSFVITLESTRVLRVEHNFKQIYISSQWLIHLHTG